MIIYVLTKNPQSNLSRIQTRLWREFEPQAELVKVQTANHHVSPNVNKILNYLQNEPHRYALILHEDCLPLRMIDFPKLLGGKTFAARVAPADPNRPHPSRTWMAVDKTIEGMTFNGFGSRPITNDDIAADTEGLPMEFLEPGFLHLDNWYKWPENHEQRVAKRDWMVKYYSDLIEMPPLRTRLLSFASATATHVRQGRPHVTRDQWLERREICRSCDFFDSGRCSHCGCGILTKSRWAGMQCPINRWPELPDEETAEQLSEPKSD